MLTQEDYWMIRELHEQGLYRKDIADRLEYPQILTRTLMGSAHAHLNTTARSESLIQRRSDNADASRSLTCLAINWPAFQLTRSAT